ncbi:hypothetical protein CIG75_01260 [Tumebacillus algifaecis]|uniref:Aminoglycoside phosphotransferase domain-containing protein n=1 Tax=Tumebacillus algifaecis TaxID=1214604 RepID=A0A223CX40_9BACL|nr:phosphotransferase [Tumebacillus algifaecis]ASS73734.1 hypothetical protein CIG75_01260 [Tumebacillus algifaecis]
MSDKFRIIRKALPGFGLDPSTLVMRRVLPENWHGDLHFKIAVGEKSYVARFIAERRSKEDATPFTNLADEVIREQMRYIDHLNNQGIPFMRRVKPQSGEAFVVVEDDKGIKRRCVLFEWLDGIHITAQTMETAFRMGEVARRYHDASYGFHSEVLPRKIHTAGYREVLDSLRAERDAHSLNKRDRARLNKYLDLAAAMIEQAHRDPSERDQLIICSDLNANNVLWDEATGGVSGIIDFDHISISDRVQDLTWLMKWYSRTVGIESHEVSSGLSHALMYGYRAHELLSDDDYARFPALLWLSGCLNRKFVTRTKKLLQNDQHGLQDHLDKYTKRGIKLTGLAEGLQFIQS